MHLIFYEADSATAKAAMFDMRRSGKPAHIRSARDFTGVPEACDEVTIMADVSGRYAGPIRAAYANKIATKRDPLDHDGDGKKGGSKAAPHSDDLAAVRDEYQRVVGKRPFMGWDAATLRAKIAEAGE